MQVKVQRSLWRPKIQKIQKNMERSRPFLGDILWPNCSQTMVFTGKTKYLTEFQDVYLHNTYLYFSRFIKYLHFSMWIYIFVIQVANLYSDSVTYIFYTFFSFQSISKYFMFYNKDKSIALWKTFDSANKIRHKEGLCLNTLVKLDTWYINSKSNNFFEK